MQKMCSFPHLPCIHELLEKLSNTSYGSELPIATYSGRNFACYRYTYVHYTTWYVLVYCKVHHIMHEENMRTYRQKERLNEVGK